MSVINDALKRAAQKPASSPSVSELAASLRPAEVRPRHFPVGILLVILVPIIAVGVWFLAKGLRMHDRPQLAPAVARAPEPMVQTQVVVLQVTAPPAPPLAPAPQPSYKLQGVFWRPSKPSAVVNGKTIYIGDRIQNAHVAAIDQNSVTLRIDGQPNPLILP